MTLADYERRKFDLVALLRDHPPDTARRAEHAELLTSLAEDRFNLVTAGRFNRGKSSLMNALLGTERLPIGIMPLTSVITSVHYGSTERATLYFHGTSLFMDVKLDELARHITETGNPGNREGVEHVEIEIPAELLRRGFRFIDTPGLGSSIAANTRTTQNFLRQADAFLVVTSFDSALSDDELAILQRAMTANARIFLAINKSDLMNEVDRAAVLDHVSCEIKARLGVEIPIFSLSARAAMDARRAKNEMAWVTSGVPELRRTLMEFQIVDKNRCFLHNMATKIGAYFAREDDRAALAQVNAIIDGYEGVAPAGDRATFNAIDGGGPASDCEICVTVVAEVFDAIVHLQARLGHDHASREALAERGCLCPSHAWQFENIAGPLAVAVGLAGLVETQANRLDATGRDPTHRICPVCASAARAEHRKNEEIAGSIEIHGISALNGLSRICLLHLPGLIAAVPEKLRPMLVGIEVSRMQRLVEDMRRFALKREGAQHHAVSAEEAVSAHAAITLLAGDPHAFPPQIRGKIEMIKPEG